MGIKAKRNAAFVEWVESLPKVAPLPEWTDADEERAMVDAYVAEAETWRAALMEIANTDLRRASAGYIQQIAIRALENFASSARTVNRSIHSPHRPEAVETP